MTCQCALNLYPTALQASAHGFKVSKRWTDILQDFLLSRFQIDVLEYLRTIPFICSFLFMCTTFFTGTLPFMCFRQGKECTGGS